MIRSLHQLWRRITRPVVVQQFLTFALVGGFATMVQYLVLIALVQGVAMEAWIASGTGYLVGGLVNYLLNYHITFHSHQKHGRTLAKFVAIAAVGFTVNTSLMAVLTRGLNWHYLIAQVLATIIVLFWNFSGNRLWTFREAEEEVMT